MKQEALCLLPLDEIVIHLSQSNSATLVVLCFPHSNLAKLALCFPQFQFVLLAISEFSNQLSQAALLIR